MVLGQPTLSWTRLVRMPWVSSGFPKVSSSLASKLTGLSEGRASLVSVSALKAMPSPAVKISDVSWPSACGRPWASDRIRPA